MPSQKTLSGLLTVRQVAEVLDLSTRTIWRYLANRQFPEPVRFSPARLRWRVSDIRAYQDQRAARGPVTL